MLHDAADVYNIYVEDIMVRDVKYIWYGITYTELKRILKENRKLKYLPLVDKPGELVSGWWFAQSCWQTT